MRRFTALPSPGGNAVEADGRTQLSDEAAALDALLQELDVPVLQLDQEMRVLFSSAAFRRLYKLPEPSSYSFPLLELLPELEGKSLLLAIERALRTGVSDQLEPTISNQFLGTRLLVNPRGLLLIFEDHTAARQLEQLRWEIVDGMAHTFQTPLTSISGYAETMLRGDGVDLATQRAFVVRIKALSESLISRVKTLLFLSRLERSSDTPRAEIDLRRSCAEALQTVIMAAEDKGIELRAELTEQPVRLLADEQQMQCAISNLLDNAIKYSHYGGVVEMRIERLGNEVALSVEDEGIGVEASAQERIFDRFFRGDNARTGEYLGAGLGLALVHDIVKAHGGRVDVSSVPGHGSRFTLILPLH